MAQDEFKFIESEDPEVEDDMYEFAKNPNLSIQCFENVFVVDEAVNDGSITRGTFKKLADAKAFILSLP